VYLKGLLKGFDRSIPVGGRDSRKGRPSKYAIQISFYGREKREEKRERRGKKGIAVILLAGKGLLVIP